MKLAWSWISQPEAETMEPGIAPAPGRSGRFPLPDEATITEEMTMNEELIGKVQRNITQKCIDMEIDDYSVVMYVLHGQEPGGFLRAVLEDSLVGAACRADQWNQKRLFQWADLMYNCIPADARGSKEKVVAWLNSGGLYGQMERRKRMAGAS